MSLQQHMVFIFFTLNTGFIKSVSLLYMFLWRRDGFSLRKMGSGGQTRNKLSCEVACREPESFHWAQLVTVFINHHHHEDASYTIQRNAGHLLALSSVLHDTP